MLPYLILLRVGFTAPPVTRRDRELLPHAFTLTPRRRTEETRFTFCGTFLGVTPTGRYPAPCPMELGLSSRTSEEIPAVICSSLSFWGEGSDRQAGGQVL